MANGKDTPIIFYYKNCPKYPTEIIKIFFIYIIYNKNDKLL